MILTNPPFGAVIKKEESPYLDNYELAKGNVSQKTEILFLERCFDFLKWETGKLAIILPDGILTNSSLQHVRDYIKGHFQILAIVSLPQTAFSHYGAGVKTSILFLRKFSQQEYNVYETNSRRITEHNEEIYTPLVKELENKRQSVIARGCPAQVAVTEAYQPQFRVILDNINELNQRLGKEPTKKVQSLRDRFIRDKAPQTAPPQFALFDPKTAHAQLSAHTADLNTLEKEYREVFKEAADSEWESEVRVEYRGKITAAKEELADKNAEDIRQWIKENANHPIFMAIADHIGYDATGHPDPINDLDMIYEEYRRFSNENPSFFG